MRRFFTKQIMNIRKAQVEDTAEIRKLIIEAVKPELNSDFDEEGIKFFYKPNDLSGQST
jgi:hypothetical protein